MLKKLPAVVAGMVLTLTAFAATVELAKDHPDTYTVRKGDTLWSISARFLHRPWQWPEVWQANPQVHNPHLIYPGDVLNLAYLNGQTSIGVASRGGAEPHTRAEQLESAIKPVPLSVIEDFLKKPRMLGEEEFRHAPHVVGIEDHHITGSPGQLVYVRDLEGQPGQHFALARPIGRYYEIAPRDGKPARLFRQNLDDKDSRPSMLWHHGPDEFSLRADVRFLGYEMLNFGDVQMTKTGAPASTIVVASDYEVRRGDFVLPLDNMPYDAEYVPHAPKQVPADMRVIAFTDALNAVGRLQVVSLSDGALDGVENGQTYSIFAKGDVVDDRSDYPELSARAFFHHEDSRVQLPEEYIGHVMVFRTFDRVSYGLIMDGIRPVHRGDKLYDPDHT
jgi:hypothetical protein